MKLSQGVEWAVHCCLILGFLEPDQVLAGKDLAEYHGLGHDYLLKQLRSLTQAGILVAGTGPNGGFKLAKPTTEITVLDIVEAIEGSTNIFRCDEIRQRGPCAAPRESYVRPCAIHQIMSRAQKAWTNELKKTTIRDLVLNVKEKQNGSKYAKLTDRWLAERGK